MNIVLAGMPGCGKTTVGEVLSQKLGRKLIDTDALIVAKYGDISSIFENYGEDYFRALERAAVAEAAERREVVISTGGGCLMNGQNVRALRASGKIVYLKTDIEELVLRLKGDSSRPLLKGDAEANLKKLYAVRAPVFAQVADFTVQTDGIPPITIAERIMELIK